MSDLESGNLQVMSSQAQGTLEGEGIEASRLLNGPISEGLRSIGYGSIDSAVAGQSAMGAASANEQAARENAQNMARTMRSNSPNRPRPFRILLKLCALHMIRLLYLAVNQYFNLNSMSMQGLPRNLRCLHTLWSEV